MLKQIKKLKVSKVGATQYYHFLFCIGKRGATRSVENPFGFWIRRGECISVAPSARPNFGSKIRFRFLAVCIKQSSNVFWIEPWCRMMRASDTLADSRVQKPKNFLAFFSRLLPPPLRREAEKEMERKFLVLLRRFSLRKEQSYFNIFVCSFLHPHGDRGTLVSAFSGGSKLCGFDGGQWQLKEYGLC